MADKRIHPITIDINPPPPSSSSAPTSPKYSGDHPKPPIPPPPSKPVPPPVTYVVQFPREQILRYPSPENANKSRAINRRRNQRSCCRRCCCFTIFLLLLLVIAVAVSIGVLYVVFRFKSPNYTVTNLSIKGMNMTSVAFMSPGFDATIRAENPNGRIGIYYLGDNSVNVFYNDVKLSEGVLPVFYQPRKNVTMLRTALRGSDVILGGAVRTALKNAQNRGRVPFVMKTKVPVKIQVGSIKTWKITVNAICDVVVDALNETAHIVSKKCDYSVRLW